jgi:hypothetical protein
MNSQIEATDVFDVCPVRGVQQEIVTCRRGTVNIVGLIQGINDSAGSCYRLSWTGGGGGVELDRRGG